MHLNGGQSKAMYVPLYLALTPPDCSNCLRIIAIVAPTNPCSSSSSRR